MAEWIRVVTPVDERLTTYADPATIRKSGSRVKMWSMVDFKEAEKIKNDIYIKSVKRQIEYDCKDEKKRLLIGELFSGNMGSGEIISTSKMGDWIPASLGTGNVELWNIVCGK
jgi:hypothetical protein